MTSQKISVTCPNCDRSVNGSPKNIGKRVKCPGCGKPFEFTPDEILLAWKAKGHALACEHGANMLEQIGANGKVDEAYNEQMRQELSEVFEAAPENCQEAFDQSYSSQLKEMQESFLKNYDKALQDEVDQPAKPWWRFW